MNEETEQKTFVLLIAACVCACVRVCIRGWSVGVLRDRALTVKSNSLLVRPVGICSPRCGPEQPRVSLHPSSKEAFLKGQEAPVKGKEGF